MSFSVDIMKNRLLRRGVARPNKYLVYITSPFGGNIEELCLRCEATSLPGKTLATTPHTIYGASREKPYNQLFETQELTFILSETMEEKKFFDAWSSIIVDPYSGYIGYHDDYATDIEIYQMGTDGFASYGVKLLEAYPKIISPVSLSYSEDNVYSKLTISFSYLKWVRVFDPQNKGSGFPTGEGLGTTNFPQLNNEAGMSTSNTGDELGQNVKDQLGKAGEEIKNGLSNLGSYLGKLVGF